ncbi:MAG: flagellar basal-body rod protein FlgF [candidate division Zixibacteria bacterium]|nr:flagellar basal-body rod protein FlgF [candidate division Zixibacteria bacterium]NIS16786.1 flagellar basal-body rod protein FlgF [candidate division Zixibacteria bacterium]NIS48973.1 flagellar basal-body rod protein FlgF [candidate division Zixibacteria bacterium]NIT53189.1 flagellar basal-body rod protein FlgF [candidate division Zixibacteria bacterium]NIU17056.1 flagellar basal-body rod protein FlgF [candidate division Zixibacteria bacterium]
MVDEIYTGFSERSIVRTGDPLNFAIDGEGFFVLETSRGETFTRNGNFNLSPEGILVTSDGHAVLSDRGPIEVSGGELNVDLDGRITVDGVEFGHLLLTDFPKPYKLEKLDAEIYRATADIQKLETKYTYVRQGFLEKANVDIIREMADMIETYRSYESDWNAVRISDEPREETIKRVRKVR